MTQLSFDDLELWKPVPGWEDFYRVSSLGRVWSTRYPGGRRPGPGGLLKLTYDKHGYPYVDFTLGASRRERFYIHQLVMLVFAGPPPPGKEVCHEDGQPANCRLSNLAYKPHRDNALDMLRHGTSHWANKTHCPAGHEYTPENTAFNSVTGGRICKQCRKRTSREFGRRKRAAKRQSPQTPSNL